jgi:hypothetical protein
MNREHVTTTLRWTGDWPWFAGLAVALLLAAIAWMLYRRDLHAHNRWLRVLLPSLRALAVILIVLMLSGPVLHHRKVIGQLARLILCIDTSESMQLADPAMDAGRKIAIARRLGLLDGAGVPLDLPQASAALADARGIADRLPPPEALGDEVWRRLSGEFAAKTAEAVALLAKAAPGSDDLARLRAEIAEPARELAARRFAGTDDQVRAASDLTRLGETAGRFSLRISAFFEKQIEADPAAAPLRAALAKFDALPRWQRLQALLLEGPVEKRILTRLAEKHDVQLVLLDGGEAKPLWHSSSGESAPPAGFPKPVAQTTDLSAGLRFAAEAAGGAEKSVVVLLTDGQHNAGESPLDAARILAGRKTSVFTVGFGSQVPPRDIAVLRVVAPDSVFFEDRVRGEIYLKEEIPPGEPFTVSVKDGGKVVWEKALVSVGKGVRRVPFEFSIKELADAKLKQQPQGYEVAGAPLQLTAEVSAIEGDRELSNNTAPLRFRAVTQKRKVMILDGRPRWETRYLRNLFDRDEKWEVNAVLAGATSDAGFIRGDKAGTFPATQKALDAYDLILFGEVPRALLKDDELKWLAEFVGRRGGAIAFIDGPRGVLRGYAGTPLAPLFPVEWIGAGVNDSVKSLALAGRAQSIGAFMLGGDSSVNADTWAKMPPPHFIAQVKALPGAEVLLEAVAGSRLPAAVLRPFGAGRVYYHAFDESWRWRYEVADLYHVRFWNQIGDYIGEAPFAARDKFVQLDAGQLTYQPGEQADIRARLRDANGRPVSDVSVNAVLFRDGQKVATITLSPDEGGLYRGRTTALESGSYELAVDTAAVPSDQLKARTQFAVTARQNAERTLLSLNEDLLRQVSLAGGGEYLREEQCDALIDRLAPLSTGQVIESDTVLWQSWWWFLPIVLLLTIEWMLRKRFGML